MIGHRQGSGGASAWLLAGGLTLSMTWTGTSLLAQELQPLETSEVQETGVLTSEEAEVLLDDLTPDEVRDLCREHPSLKSTAPCKRVLEDGGDKGNGTSGAGAASSSEAPGALALESAGPTGAPAGAASAETRGQATRPRISVDKTNDADGDGVFTSDEVAERPGADVPFRVKITNLGRRTVRVETILDSYRETREHVCGELRGQRIRPASSKMCSFVLEDYAPRRFDSVANNVDVRVREPSSGRTTTGSDISTVTTITGGEDQVLTERVRDAGGQDSLASTGFDLLAVAAAAMLLVLSGAGLVRLGGRADLAGRYPAH